MTAAGSTAEGDDCGFTLVELIVVVAIIGVLAAIAVPVFLGQAASAREKVDIAALSQVKVALNNYLAEGNTAQPNLSDLVAHGGPASVEGTLSIDVWTPSLNVYDLVLTGGASGKTCIAANWYSPECS